jgi:hypothetical protein
VTPSSQNCLRVSDEKCAARAVIREVRGGYAQFRRSVPDWQRAFDFTPAGKFNKICTLLQGKLWEESSCCYLPRSWIKLRSSLSRLYKNTLLADHKMQTLKRLPARRDANSNTPLFSGLSPVFLYSDYDVYTHLFDDWPNTWQAHAILKRPIVIFAWRKWIF